MPRISERARFLESIEDAIETAICSDLLASKDEENEIEKEEDKEDVEDLLELYDPIDTYLVIPVPVDMISISLKPTSINIPRLHFLLYSTCIGHLFGSSLRY